MSKMFPQSELDNYKLQVELLQEKLKRSEDQRQQLEEKFENIIKKRSEQEKIMKIKSRIKYQQFLEEQRERNERNRALVKLLERVDQQAAVLAAKSERLKMMKLQYEIYFAKLLQTQTMRSIHSSPRNFQTVIPLNHVVTNSNIPVGIQDVSQPSKNLSTNSAMVSENFTIIPNNLTTSNNNTNFIYRIPGNFDYFNGQIVLNQDVLPRQVNLKSTLGDTIGSGYGYPIQVGTIPDTRRNPIEFDHYKSPNLNIPSAYSDDKSPLKAIWTNTHHQNPNEIQSVGHTNNSMQGDPGNDEYHQKEVDNPRSSYHILTSDKLPNIKQDTIRERILGEVNENDTKTNVSEKEYEKLLSMNAIQGDTAPIDVTKQKTDESKENWMSTEKSMRMVQDLFLPDKLLKNTSQINSDKPKNPVMWNFGGRIDTEKGIYPIQFEKKEKLSMENFETKIYGERISPINKNREVIREILPKSPNKQPPEEKSEIKIKPQLQQLNIQEKYDASENHEEKYDESEKELKSIEENKGLVSSVQNTIPAESNEIPSAVQQPKIQEKLSNSPPTEVNSNQIFSDNYLQNFNNLQNNENPEIERIPVNTDIQSTTSYPNYEYSETKSTEEATGESALKETQSEETYQANEYQGQDYQYPNYAQGQEYANYPPGQYPADYSQQQYDPNSYAYNYNHQTDDGTYQQDSSIYQGDALYQQTETSYQPDGSYQQPTDSSYYQEGANTYQDSDMLYQPDEANYQDPNQQLYTGADYSGQSYPGYEYSENDYADYKVQEPNGASDMPTHITGDQNQNESKPLDDSTQNAPDNSEEDVKTPIPPAPTMMPPSILSTEKPPDVSSTKKKKKVNFVDSETEESSSAAVPPKKESTAQNNDESDFDFSST